MGDSLFWAEINLSYQILSGTFKTKEIKGQGMQVSWANTAEVLIVSFEFIIHIARKAHSVLLDTFLQPASEGLDVDKLVMWTQLLFTFRLNL